jgi:hypothetical protein
MKFKDVFSPTGKKEPHGFLQGEELDRFRKEITTILTKVISDNQGFTPEQVYKAVFYAGIHSDERAAFVLGILSAQMMIAFTGQNPASVRSIKVTDKEVNKNE